MKKFILSTVLSAAVLASSVTGFAAEIPGESLPDGASEEAVKITESIMGSILDEVYDGLGYGAASGRANTLIRQAVDTKKRAAMVTPYCPQYPKMRSGMR